jgi:hypothetical protein
MDLKPKVRYQLFLYNYFLEYIEPHLYNEYYNTNNTPILVLQCNRLTDEINELDNVNDYEFIKYKKSRGKHRKHLFFLSCIRHSVLSNKRTKLAHNIRYIEAIEEKEKKNENKFMYKDYSDYYNKHINHYQFLQKIKHILKLKYDNIIENTYKTLYSPKILTQLIDTMPVEDAFNYLHVLTQDKMCNVF